MGEAYQMTQEDLDDMYMVHDALARINDGIHNEKVYYLLGFHWGRLQKIVYQPAISTVFQRIVKADPETTNIVIQTLVSQLPRAEE